MEAWLKNTLEYFWILGLVDEISLSSIKLSLLHWYFVSWCFTAGLCCRCFNDVFMLLLHAHEQIFYFSWNNVWHAFYAGSSLVLGDRTTGTPYPWTKALIWRGGFLTLPSIIFLGCFSSKFSLISKNVFLDLGLDLGFVILYIFQKFWKFSEKYFYSCCEKPMWQNSKNIFIFLVIAWYSLLV